MLKKIASFIGLVAIMPLFMASRAFALDCLPGTDCPCYYDEDPEASDCIPQDAVTPGDEDAPVIEDYPTSDLPDQTPDDSQPETTPEDSPSDDSEDEAAEAAEWPVYISIGAIGATLLLIIIINIAGHRK